MGTTATVDRGRAIEEAVPVLHRSLRRRADGWEQLARDLGGCTPGERGRILRALVVELDHHLLPYMELEERLLAERGTDEPLLQAEHEAIRRAVHRVRNVAGAGEVHPYLAQVVVASLQGLVHDHLLHEHDAYLPAISRP